MAVDLKRNPKIFYRHENGSGDENTYEPTPVERPLRIFTTIEPNDNNDYTGSGSISLPDPRPQLSIPPRGANAATPGPKSPVLIGKPVSIVTELRMINNSIKITTEFHHKPPSSPEEMSIPPLTGKVRQIKTNVLVPTPFIQSVPLPSMQQGSPVNTRTGLMYSPSIFAENTNLSSRPWYASKCDRNTANAVLHENGTDGAFLVRPSSGCDRNQPYTLAVLHRGKVYNVPIRFIEGNNQYALGKEKAGEMWFNSVQGMMDYYQQNTLILIDQQNSIKDPILLLYPVRM
ncbi:B-cell linker protein-like [Cetorhinus maximus]